MAIQMDWLEELEVKEEEHDEGQHLGVNGGVGEGEHELILLDGEENEVPEENEITAEVENDQQEAIDGRVEKGEAEQDNEDLGVSGTGLDIHTSIPLRTNDFFSSEFFKECPLGVIKVLAKFVEFYPLLF